MLDQELRNLIKEVDLWLGLLYFKASDIQKDFLQAKGLELSKEARNLLSINISQINNLSSELKKEIENQKESISILRRTPPGWKESVIDFMYNIVVDPKAPSQKEQYMEKLRGLDQSVNKKTTEIGSALPIPEKARVKIIRDLTTKTWQLNDPELIKKITTNTDSLMQNAMNGFNRYEDDLRGLISTFETFNKASEVKDSLKDFLKKLYQHLQQFAAPEYEEVFKEGFQSLIQSLDRLVDKEGNLIEKQEVEAFSTRRTIEANKPLGDLRAIVDEHLQALASFHKDVSEEKFIKMFGQLMMKLEQSSEKVELAQKYNDYIEALFGLRGRNNIRSLVLALYKEFKTIQKRLKSESITPPQSDGQNQEKSNQETPEQEPKGVGLEGMMPEDSGNPFDKVSKLHNKKKHLYSQLKKLKQLS